MAKKKLDSKKTELELQVTPVFNKNAEAFEKGYRYIVNQGGSRSSKSYSIAQLLIVLAIKQPLTISIVRKSLPSLKNSILKDFLEILKTNGIYNEQNHNKTECIYEFSNGSQLQFFSVDDEQKLRGSKRDILYCNEANELSFPEFNQLILRTTGQVFIDYNPSDTEHWIYDKVLSDKKATLIKSTYKDNPFLTKVQVEYIENLINVDQNYYKVYALGERPISESRIYTHFKKYKDNPPTPHKITFGLDFGYNHPTSLVRVIQANNKYYIDEWIYESKLTTDDLIQKMNNLFTDDLRDKPIYCDYARPETIEQLKRAGYNAKPADKIVKAGIDFIKSKEVYIHQDSANLWKEVSLYSWKTSGDQILDEPIKLNDDGLDAMRYAIYTGKKAGSGKVQYDFIFL